MPSFNVSCYVVFGGYFLEACCFGCFCCQLVGWFSFVFVCFLRETEREWIWGRGEIGGETRRSGRRGNWVRM